MGDLANSFLIAYIILSVTLKRPLILSVFLLCECLFLFDTPNITEWQLYSIELCLWSYVITSLKTKRTTVSCGIICLLSFICFIDAFYYGVNTNGEGETWVYVNIEFIAMLAHIVFIASFVNVGRINNDIRHFINSIVNITVNGDYRVIIDYNKTILTKCLLILCKKKSY